MHKLWRLAERLISRFGCIVYTTGEDEKSHQFLQDSLSQSRAADCELSVLPNITCARHLNIRGIHVQGDAMRCDAMRYNARRGEISMKRFHNRNRRSIQDNL